MQYFYYWNFESRQLKTDFKKFIAQVGKLMCNFPSSLKNWKMFNQISEIMYSLIAGKTTQRKKMIN